MKKRIKYKENEEYRLKVIEKAKAYHVKKIEELGIQKKTSRAS